MKQPSEQARRDFLRKLIAAELLAKRGEGPLALRPPRSFACALESELPQRPVVR